MRWIGITGTWRLTNKDVESDVRNVVSRIIKAGNGIVTGGALGVDSFALDEAMKQNRNAESIRVILPSSLALYKKHYQKRATEGIITNEQSDTLINQLYTLQKINKNSLIENANTSINKTTYYQRNQTIIDLCDELIAFQVNKSAGVQDTIEKAKNNSIPIKLFSYTI